MKGTDKFLVMIVIGVILLVSVAFAVTLLRPKPTYKTDDAPEGVAHNYLLALQQEDFERAYSYISPSLTGYPIDGSSFMENVKRYSWSFRTGTDTTLAIESAKITGGSAVVTVCETRFYRGGLFDSNQRISTFDMELQLENDEWRITDSDYYFANCWNYEGGCQ